MAMPSAQRGGYTFRNACWLPEFHSRDGVRGAEPVHPAVRPTDRSGLSNRPV